MVCAAGGNRAGAGCTAGAAGHGKHGGPGAQGKPAGEKSRGLDAKGVYPLPRLCVLKPGLQCRQLLQGAGRAPCAAVFGCQRPCPFPALLSGGRVDQGTVRGRQAPGAHQGAQAAGRLPQGGGRGAGEFCQPRYPV